MPYFTRVPYAEMLPKPPAPGLGQAEDIVALATAVLGTQAGRLPLGTEAPTALGPRAPVRAGSRATILLTVTHDPGTPPVQTGLLASDLTGPSGCIPSSAVRIDPATLALSEGGSADVRVTLTVPPDTPPGPYRGLIRTAVDDGFAETLRVEVVQA